MYKVVLLAVLVAFASAARFQDTHTILAEIDKTHFGSTVLSAIQVALQTKTPSDEVNMLLNSVVAGINEDQKQHDQVNRTAQAACSRITIDLENNINYYNSEIAANTLLRDDNTVTLEQAEQDVRQAAKDIEDNEATQAREQATRNDQNAVWVRKDAEHESAIAAVDDGAKLIQHLSLGASFAQVKSRYEQLQKKLDEQTSHLTLFKPIIAALTELASEGVNQKALTRIAQLLSELRQQLVASRSNLRDVEEKQVARWAEFKAHLVNEHTRLTNRKQELEELISSCKQNIETAEEFIEVYTLELENDTEGLYNQEQWCELQSALYARLTTERAQELEDILRVQEHIVEHLAGSAQFLAGRSVN